jgi:hypothetical protein
MITTLASFNGANGANPAGDLIRDAQDNLFGTTELSRWPEVSAQSSKA